MAGFRRRRRRRRSRASWARLCRRLICEREQVAALAGSDRARQAESVTTSTISARGIRSAYARCRRAPVMGDRRLTLRILLVPQRSPRVDRDGSQPLRRRRAERRAHAPAVAGDTLGAWRQPTTLPRAAFRDRPAVPAHASAHDPPLREDDDWHAGRSEPGDEEAFTKWLTPVAAPAALAELQQPPYGERGVVSPARASLWLTGLVPALGPSAQLEGGPPGGSSTPEPALLAPAPAHRGRGWRHGGRRRALCRALRDAPPAFGRDHGARERRPARGMRRLGMRLPANPHPEPTWLQVVGVLDAPGTS